MRYLSMIALVLIMSACWATPHETEWCVKTRYGAIKQVNLSPGFQWVAPVDDVACFDVTERQFPPGNAEAAMTVTASTSDPLEVGITYQIVVQLNYENMEQTFLDKRTERQIERDLMGGIESGTQDAIAGWSMTEIFSERRTELADSIEVHVNGRLGDMAEVKRVFLINVQAPQQIEAARLAANEQENYLVEERNKALVDSTRAWAQVNVERANLETARLQAESQAVRVAEEGAAYRNNPGLLQLHMTRAMADGLAGACDGASTCILGDGLLQSALAQLGR